MTKIRLDMGNGEIVELRNDKGWASLQKFFLDDVDHEETIRGMVSDYLKKYAIVKYSHIEKCTFNGVDICPSTAVTEDDEEICVKVAPTQERRVTESIENGRDWISDRLDEKFSAFMESLTERMDDSTLSRVQTVKSMVGQLLSPKNTPEYTKLNADYRDLRKKLALTQEDFKKENSRLKDVISECKAECREKDEIAVKLRDELNRARSQCNTNLQMLKGYRHRVDDEIEKNVKSKSDLEDLNAKIAQLWEQIEPLKKELAAKEEALKKQKELGREMAQKASDADEDEPSEENRVGQEKVFEEEEATEKQQDEVEDEESDEEESSEENIEGKRNKTQKRLKRNMKKPKYRKVRQ